MRRLAMLPVSFRVRPFTAAGAEPDLQARWEGYLVREAVRAELSDAPRLRTAPPKTERTAELLARGTVKVDPATARRLARSTFSRWITLAWP